MAGEKTRKVGKGMGEMSEATTGDGGGTKKEKAGDRHPRHVRYPPTFQRWLRLSLLFFSRRRSEGWPHHGRTFSIYPCPLSF